MDYTNCYYFIRRYDLVIAQEWFTVAEAAEYLRVSRKPIYKLTLEGRLPEFRIGQER